MSKDICTFCNYIMNNSSDNITQFKITFRDRLDNIPNKMVSSKYLMNVLKPLSIPDSKIFKETYLDYFRTKLNEARV